MSLWSRKPFIAVRTFGTHGSYPNFEIRSSSHLFIPTAELVWSAALQPALPEDWEVGEFTPLVPEEVRLLSSIALCESDTWARGIPVLTHWANSHLDPAVVGFDLTNENTFDQVRDAAADLGSGPGTWTKANEIKIEYTIRDVGQRGDAILLLQNIDSNDQLLLAGLARLLGANRLLAVANEPEEAAISLFISTGAALEFIRLHLCDTKGSENVPFSEVYGYFRRTFPNGDQVAEYFQERYDERIIATHPSNRFGEFWAPPLMMGDVYHLRKAVIALYRHLFLGEVEGW